MSEESITMVNNELGSCPELSVPPEYSIHWYDVGDEEAWVKINGKADKYNVITKKLFVWSTKCR